jgi:hypothetical protein
VDFGVGAKVGTNGVGLTKTINACLSAAAPYFEDNNESITVDDEGAKSDIDADLDLDYWPLLVIGINYAF